MIRKYISQIKNINSTELKKKLKEEIEKTIEELKEIYKNNKEFIDELISLLLEMKTILNVDSYTFFHFEKLIGRYIIYLFEQQHPKKVLKDSNKK